jgi:GntR family transcriptional regulator, transcriptional repressor for pyruvate dehydrogenase complex
MAGFNQVDRRRYSDQVIESIKTEILTNRFAVGDKLPREKDLTEQFNVSRTVVREAIRALEESGLVEIRKGPKGGVFVTKVFHKPVSNSLKSLADHGEITIDHLFDVRLLIEPHIAAEAAMKATPSDLESLHALIEESLSQQDDVALLKQNNINFHLLLARAAGNPVLCMLMESVVPLLVELTQNFTHLPSGQEHSKVHEKLLSLVERRRSAEASALIKKDIAKVKERIRQFQLKTPTR